MSLLFIGACQSFDENLSSVELQTGNFVVEYPREYSIAMTRGETCTKSWIEKTRNGDFEIMESEWEVNASHFTRSSNVGNDVKWEDSLSVGLYISNENSVMSVRNVPLNPLTHAIQNYYYDETKGNASDDDIKNITKEQVKTTSFFWEDWSQKDKMPTGAANFYGVYPRPRDHSSYPYKYVRNSVISSSTVNDENNCVSYVFWTAQNDQNMRQFDLMYSKSESETTNGFFGNQKKNKGDNIVMPFEHAFSLLNIEILKGANYTGTGKLTNIYVKGTEVPTTGTLNYVTGELIKGTDEGVINRIIDETILSSTKPFTTDIIIPPSSDEATSVEGKERLALICKIDGNEYKYEFPNNIKIIKGKKYNLKLTLSPSGLSYLNVWYGADVKLDNNVAVTGSKSVSGNSTFTVKAKEGYVIGKITKNGETLRKTEDGKYNIEKNCTYNIVAYPTEENWYSAPADMRVQFDGIMNSAYQETQDNGTSVWQDITGNDNDGNLKSFNGTVQSGWNNNGLTFDGIDDIVIFPGTINASKYTMEFFIAFDKQKSGATPRLNAEGTAYPAYYLRNLDRKNGLGYKWYVGLFGHDCALYDSELYIEDDKSLVQLDMVYENHTVKVYKNGEQIGGVFDYGGKLKDAVSIPEASLGNRSADNTRTTTGTYYSYILYDKVLSTAEMKHNLNLNKKRFK